MGILVTKQVGELEYPVEHDVTSKRYYNMVYRPRVRLDSTEYYKDDAVVLPTSDGLIHIVVDPGISAASIPTFTSDVKGITEDGSVKWKAGAYNLILRTGDRIAEVADVTPDSPSVWTATTGVTLEDAGYDDRETWVKVTSVLSSLKKFTLTNTVIIKRLDGKFETVVTCLTVPVKVC